MTARTTKTTRAPAKAKPKAAPRARWNAPAPTRGGFFDLKKREVIHQAGLAFKQKGFHETSMDDVAAALGVSKAALYRYVEDKYELLFECHKVAMDLGDAALAHAKANGKTGFERTYLALESFVTSYISSNSAGAAIVNIDALKPAHRAEIVRRRDHFDHGLRGFIREGIEDGSVRPCDPSIATFAMMGAINWLPRWYNPEGSLSGPEVTRRMLDLFSRGLASAGPEERA